MKLKSFSKISSGFTRSVDFGFVFEIYRSNFIKMFSKLGDIMDLTFGKTKTFKISKPKFTAGFTLVEVLTVIAIIAILSSLVYASLSDTRAKSRDTQRVGDISTIQLQLAMYYGQNQTNGGVNTSGQYPITLNELKPTYLPEIPKDPNGNSYYYVAYKKTGSTKCTNYHLGSKLELPNGQIDNNYPHFNSSVTATDFNTSPAKYVYCDPAAVGFDATGVNKNLWYDVRP